MWVVGQFEISFNADIAIAILILYAGGKKGSINMAKYRLRAAKRNPDGTFDTALLDDIIDADTLVEAIEKARNFPAILADPFITGCIWMTDENDNTVWNLEV